MIEHQLMCKGKHQPIRLATITKAGIYFWCKSCHGRQLFPWEELDKKREELNKIEEENASTTARPVLY